MARMTAARAAVEILRREGITSVFGLPGAGQDRGKKPFGPLGRQGGIGALHTQRADRRRPWCHRPLWSEVQEHPGAALQPQLHGLGPVLAVVGESERGQALRHDRSGDVIDSELGERVAAQ